MFKIEQAHWNIQGHGKSTLPFLGRDIRSIPIRGRGQIKPTPNYYAMVSLELPAPLLYEVDIVSAPARGRLLWMSKVKGVRNLFM